MADVVIRGMEMPDRRTAELMHTELACVSRECNRHCENCDLVQDRDELIVAFHEAIRVLETVANAVPLPEGHGRLIDADAFLATIRPLCTEDAQAACTLETVKQLMVKRISSAPTVVPKEGGAWYG